MFPTRLIATLGIAALALGALAMVSGPAVAQQAPRPAPRPPVQAPPPALLPLQAAVAEFLSRSPDLASERLVPTIAAIDRALAAERFRPQAAIEALAGRRAYEGLGAAFGPVAVAELPGGGTVRTGVALAPGSRSGEVQGFATLDIPLLRGAGERAAQVQLRVATLQARIATLGFEARTAGAAALFMRDYVLLDTLDRRRREAEEALRRARDQLRILRGLVDRGVLAMGDTLELEASAIQRELDLQEFEAEAARQRLLLLGLLGRDATRAFRTAVPDPLRWPIPPEAELVATAVQRPEVQLRALRVTVAEENLLLARDGLRWDLSVVGDIRTRTIDDRNLYFGDRRVGSTDVAYTVGLRLQVPLTTDSAELRVSRANAELQRARLELQAARDQAEREVLQRRAILRRELDRRVITERLLEVTTQKLQLEQRRLELGRGTALQFRLAEEELVRARAQLTEDLSRVLLAWIDLLNASSQFQLPP